MNHFTNSKIKQNKPFKLYKNNRIGDNFADL